MIADVLYGFLVGLVTTGGGFFLGFRAGRRSNALPARVDIKNRQITARYNGVIIYTGESVSDAMTALSKAEEGTR